MWIVEVGFTNGLHLVFSSSPLLRGLFCCWGASKTCFQTKNMIMLRLATSVANTATLSVNLFLSLNYSNRQLDTNHCYTLTCWCGTIFVCSFEVIIIKGNREQYKIWGIYWVKLLIFLGYGIIQKLTVNHISQVTLIPLKSFAS